MAQTNTAVTQEQDGVVTLDRYPTSGAQFRLDEEEPVTEPLPSCIRLKLNPRSRAITLRSAQMPVDRRPVQFLKVVGAVAVLDVLIALSWGLPWLPMAAIFGSTVTLVVLAQRVYLKR